MMMMTVMMRIMTWVIIVNESRKQSNKVENVWKDKINLLSQSVQKPGRRQKTQHCICRPIAFIWQSFLY